MKLVPVWWMVGCASVSEGWAPPDPLFPDITPAFAGCSVTEVDSIGVTVTHTHDDQGRSTQWGYDAPHIEYTYTAEHIWNGRCLTQMSDSAEVGVGGDAQRLEQEVERRCDSRDHVLSVEVTESWAAAGVVAEYDNHYVDGELSRIDERSNGGDAITTTSTLAWEDGHLVERVATEDDGQIEVNSWSWSDGRLEETRWERVDDGAADAYVTDHLWEGERWLGYDEYDQGAPVAEWRFEYSDGVHEGRLPVALHGTPAGAEQPDHTVEYAISCE